MADFIGPYGEHALKQWSLDTIVPVEIRAILVDKYQLHVRVQMLMAFAFFIIDRIAGR